jgi:chromosome partitioning protein
MSGREYILRNAIATTRDAYDFVLIDCPPSLGLLTINALVAANETIVPLQCEFLAVRGLDALVDAIGRVQRRLNPQLRLLGILPTMYSDRRNHCGLVLKKVRERYPQKVFDVMVKQSVLFAEAPAERRTILELRSKAEGAGAYRALAELVIGDKG